MIQKFVGPAALGVLLASGVASGAMGVSGAYFTDEQLGSKTTIYAGTLALVGATTQKITAANLLPGDVGTKDMTFRIDGGDTWFKLSASSTKDELGGLLRLSYELYGSTLDASGTIQWNSTPVDTAATSDGGMTNVAPLPEGSYKVIANYKLDETAGNEYQSKKYEGNFKFDIYQAKNVAVNPYR